MYGTEQNENKPKIHDVNEWRDNIIKFKNSKASSKRKTFNQSHLHNLSSLHLHREVPFLLFFIYLEEYLSSSILVDTTLCFHTTFLFHFAHNHSRIYISGCIYIYMQLFWRSHIEPTSWNRIKYFSFDLATIISIQDVYKCVEQK